MRKCLPESSLFSGRDPSGRAGCRPKCRGLGEGENFNQRLVNKHFVPLTNGDKTVQLII